MASEPISLDPRKFSDWAKAFVENKTIIYDHVFNSSNPSHKLVRDTILSHGSLRARIVEEKCTSSACTLSPSPCFCRTLYLQFTHQSKKMHVRLFYSDHYNAATTDRFSPDFDIEIAASLSSSKDLLEAHERLAALQDISSHKRTLYCRRNRRPDGESKGIDGTVKDRFDKEFKFNTYNTSFDVCAMAHNLPVIPAFDCKQVKFSPQSIESKYCSGSGGLNTWTN